MYIFISTPVHHAGHARSHVGVSDTSQLLDLYRVFQVWVKARTWKGRGAASHRVTHTHLPRQVVTCNFILLHDARVKLILPGKHAKSDGNWSPLLTEFRKSVPR